ncbi:unnamed protein product [Clonostachys rosea f. rosea IK726]|jgi:predicted amidohydrolase YtcJ|uniref:Amidohydrolase 3 domain-containing protein n=2 Tax=Bionectria ochroleuca TaxID=29856 RepID=A0A0B7K1U4_BIOOC|nr:unnamed protein product [Clonostachys rosea f. rosea IK726]
MRTLAKNARIITGESPELQQPLSCLAIRDNIIEYRGRLEDAAIIDFLRHDDVKQVDLGGRNILPAFVDGHVHLLHFGISLSKIDLGDCGSLDDIRQAIQMAAAGRPDAKRLLFHRWKQSAIPGKATSSMLEGLDPRPIYIDAHDLHSAWCNGAALDELNLPSTNPPGGIIHRDEHGAPTGLLEEGAVVSLVWPFLADLMSRAEKLDRIREAVAIYNRAGYTTVIDMAVTQDYWELLHELHVAGELKLRVAAHFLVLPTGDAETERAQVEHASKLHQSYNLSTSPELRVAGIKIICDGVVDACTAAVSKPYQTTGETVQPFWTPETLQRVLAVADGSGLQCALHAIGDEAVTLAVDGLESLCTTGRRHRIEHLELTKPEDARRLGRLGITASVQPVHCDPEQNTLWPPLIGKDLYTRAFAYREFLDAGANLAIGTDAPTAPHQPWNNLFNATTRRTYQRPHDKETCNEHFKLDLVEALAASSMGSAYSCFAENMVGSLAAGKRADFIVLDGVGDWRHDPASLLTCRVVGTWLDGRPVWSELG